MGLLNRIAIVIRSYLRVTSDRIERVAAEEELRLARARKEAADELAAETLGDTAGRAVPAATPRVRPELARLAADYRLLGLLPAAELSDVEARWRTLAQRADPKRFPAGSDEEKQAAEILRSVNAAYARIREAANPTEGRFGRIEL